MKIGLAHAVGQHQRAHVVFGSRQDRPEHSALSYSGNCMAQDFPKLDKQPKWDSKVKPDKVNWDAEIKAAVEKGKEVPEVTWVKPGEDEAMKVG